jgi:pyridinium-3,5-biscarboxylic acid mononucleotide sulfurtransferase
MPDRELIVYFVKRRKSLVAFSGGVDSSVLAKAAHKAQGGNALAVTFDTPTTSKAELAHAKQTADKIGIKHIVVKYSELGNSVFSANPHDRCYHCKKLMTAKLKEVAKQYAIESVVEGTNASDLNGHRPGYKALTEAGIESPFVTLGMTKDDIRAIAKNYGLDWNRPSNACLASRIPTGGQITAERLRKVDDAEEYLRSLGLTQVRVRLGGSELDEARIEVRPAEFTVVLKNSDEILGHLQFRKVTLDLAGYREK